MCFFFITLKNVELQESFLARTQSSSDALTEKCLREYYLSTVILWDEFGGWMTYSALAYFRPADANDAY